MLFRALLLAFSASAVLSVPIHNQGLIKRGLLDGFDLDLLDSLDSGILDHLTDVDAIPLVQATAAQIERVHASSAKVLKTLEKAAEAAKTTPNLTFENTVEADQYHSKLLDIADRLALVVEKLAAKKDVFSKVQGGAEAGRDILKNTAKSAKLLGVLSQRVLKDFYDFKIDKEINLLKALVDLLALDLNIFD